MFGSGETEGSLSGYAKWARDIPWIDRPDESIDGFLDKYIPSYANLREHLIDWRDKGFVILESAIDTDLIDRYVNELDFLRENLHKYLVSIELRGTQTWSAGIKKDDIDGPQVKLNHLHVASLYAARLSLAKPIVDFLRTIFLAPPLPMQSLTFLRGSQQRTHIDYPYVKKQRRIPYMAASWVALEDVTEKSGPLQYFSGAHKPELSGFFDWGMNNIIPSPNGQNRSSSEFSDYLDARLSAKSITPTAFLPKKGDVLIWHANLPHLGSPVLDPASTRKSYVTHYTGLFDYPTDWFPRPLTDIHYGFSQNGGAIFEYPWDRGKQKTKLPSWSEKPSSDDLGQILDIYKNGEEKFQWGIFHSAL